MPNPTLKTDIVIIGAGIAGLWLLARLQQLGFNAVLLEKDAIGGGQTIASQGIIHGGAKYALTGALAQTGHAVADMPELWQACLAGKGELDLHGVKVLSPYQYLWSAESLTSRIATFFASKTLQSRVQTLSRAQFPLAFQHPRFKGQVYQLQELVIDVPSLITQFATRHHANIMHCNAVEFNYDHSGKVAHCRVQLANNEPLTITAQRYIVTAGEGAEALLKDCATTAPPMQRRPLQMVMVKHRLELPLYAHCLTANPKPRITITTHQANDGQTVWYLGGLLAENGVQQEGTQLINTAHAELAALFPWLDLSSAHYQCLRINRAEPAQSDGILPGTTYTKQLHNLIIGWPTKLALAPKLAAEIIALLNDDHIVPQQAIDASVLAKYPTPPVATPVWDR